MRIPTKKLKSGFEIPVYGMGTWEIAGKRTFDPTYNTDSAISAIREAIKLGVTHIDTAESYAQGHAELVIGEAIAVIDRKRLFLASKAHLEHLSYDLLIKAARESIKRLGTSYLDLYYAHRYSMTIPVKETMRAMDTLVDEGIIRYIGVSNFTVEEFAEAQSYAKHKIVANQLHLNMKYREAQRRGLLKYAQTNDVMFVAWRPLQKGMILSNGGFLQEFVKKYNRTPAQIALNWLISQKNVVTIAKTTNPKHLQENLGAIGWEMDKEDIARIEVQFPDQCDISDAVPLHRP